MLTGREAEIGRIEAALTAVRSGEGGALVLHGEPGIGKSALLDHAERNASGLRCLRTAGLEAESSLPFSALAELSESLLDGIGALPPPQARAIEAALALAPPAPGERFAVCAGFLGLLSRAGAEQPLLLLIDDTQWLDRASAECVAYAARRLRGKPVAALAAARGSAPPAMLAGPGVEMVPVRGLDPASARELLLNASPDLAASVAESLLEAAAGNPLALRELPSLLTAEQRSASSPLEQPLPPGLTLQRAFEQRIATVPPQTRRACLLAATAFTPRLEDVRSACRELGLDPGELERAEQAGLLRLTAGRFEFDHPLLRGAVVQGASAADRRRAHEALARCADDGDARAWHRAAATLGADDAVADEMEAVAARASARAAHGTAADALEQAARLSTDREQRARRLLGAGVAAATGGAYDRGLVLLGLADEIDDPATRGAVRRQLALLTLNGGVRGAEQTRELLIAEAEAIAATDPAAAAGSYADAGLAAAVGGNCVHVLDAAERAIAVLPDTAPEPVRCQALATLGLGLTLRGRSEEAREPLNEAGRLLRRCDPLAPAAQTVAFALGGRRSTGQERLLLEEAEWLEAAAKDAGAGGLFPYYQVLVADCDLRIGRLERASAKITEAIEGARESGQVASLGIALAVGARIAAIRGQQDAAREAVAEVDEIAPSRGFGSTAGWARAALGFLELSLDRLPEAIAALEPLEQLPRLAGFEDPLVIPWAPDLVEALCRSGRREDGGAVAALLQRQAQGSPAALASALAARCAGLVARSSFDDDFERALELHGEADSPFEHARTLLAYGSRLHRARRRVDARERLRRAAAMFATLGAPLWEARAAAELKAAGAVRRRRVYEPTELTAQEVRVALAAARGAKNREIAGELFLSPKTIEFHLGRVYRKLNIHSRAELATAVAAGALESGERSAAEQPAE